MDGRDGGDGRDRFAVEMRQHVTVGLRAQGTDEPATARGADGVDGSERGSGGDEMHGGGHSGGYEGSALEQLRHTMGCVPKGRTPLCEHLRQVQEEIRGNASALRRKGQKAIIVIATDGKPTDGRIVDVLMTFADLPVHVVVRLCTNNDKVVEYVECKT